VALDFQGSYQDNLNNLTAELDELDKTYDRETPAGILSLMGNIKCMAHFDCVDNLK